MPKRTRKPIEILPHRQSSGLFYTGGEYVADIKPDDGKRIIRKLGTDRLRALKLFDEIKEELENKGGANPLLADFLKQTFLPSQVRLKSYCHSQKKVNVLVRFLEACYPTLRLSDVKRFHADAMRDFYRDRAPQTLNENLQKFKQALNYATDMGLLEANPLQRVKPLPVDNRRHRVLSMGDFCRLVAVKLPKMNHFEFDIADMLTVLGLTGLRPSNLLALRTDELDATGQVFRFPPEKMKNSKWGILPVSGYIVNVLTSKRREDSPFFFSSFSDPQKPRPYLNLNRLWKHVAKAADVEFATAYDLRHFFASELTRLGATELQVARLLCHSPQSVTSRYAHVEVEDVRPFVERLAERFLAASGRDVLPHYRELLTGDEAMTRV